jgi:hypothetical protein
MQPCAPATVGTNRLALDVPSRPVELLPDGRVLPIPRLLPAIHQSSDTPERVQDAIAKAVASGAFMGWSSPDGRAVVVSSSRGLHVIALVHGVIRSATIPGTGCWDLVDVRFDREGRAEARAVQTSQLPSQ